MSTHESNQNYAECTHYLRLDEVVQQISKAGQWALLAKMDIDSAYCNVPVHPADRPFMGMQWKGRIFFDTQLPFGLRSAPKIFLVVADALQWSFLRRGMFWVAHYLDDFITVGSPGSPECQTILGIMLATCQRLGVPVAQKTCVCPAAVLVFLGFELNTNQMVIRLPEDKLHCTLSLVKDWLGKKLCKKRDLKCLLGHLQHAATVMCLSRTFVRRLIELVSTVQTQDRWIHLSSSTRSVLNWWFVFMERWNGVSMVPKLSMPAIIPLETVASGSWGCGAH